MNKPQRVSIKFVSSRALFNLLLTFILCSLLLCTSCSQQEPTLPIMGAMESDFQFVNQSGETVTEQAFANKVYVADFFFTTCPTICPIMTSQMARVYDAFIDEPQLLILSHSIDPGHDTVDVLNNYAGRLEIDSSKWHMVTGEKEKIHAIAKEYMLGVVESSQAPGGFIHSGSFCLLDKKKQIRGFYSGTDTEEVNQLIKDIAVLLHE